MAHETRQRFVGRRTFAVTFGERGSQRLFTALLALPFALVPLMAYAAQANGLLLPLLLLPAASKLQRTFINSPGGVAMNEVLYATFRLGLWFAALVSVTAVLIHWTQQ